MLRISHYYYLCYFTINIVNLFVQIFNIMSMNSWAAVADWHMATVAAILDQNPAIF